MKVIVIGATGTIGQAVVNALTGRHEVVQVSRSSGDLTADIDSPESLKALFEQAAPFDAVVCAAGQAVFKPLSDLTDADFHVGFSSKLMGQVNIVRLGLAHVRDGGSFTLTSGILSWQPLSGCASISMVGAGLEAFVRAASLEMPRGVRINVVSPPWVSETLAAMGRNPSEGLPAATIAGAYVDAVEGGQNGAVIDGREYA